MGSKLLDNFAESIEGKYGDLTLTEIKRICRSHFRYLREKMGETSSFKSLNIQYFGRFIANNKNINGAKIGATKLFMEGNLDEDVYREFLEKFKDKEYYIKNDWHKERLEESELYNFLINYEKENNIR